MGNDDTSDNKGTHINWNDDDYCHICMNGQMTAIINGEASKDEKGQLYMDELMTLKFGMDNCCTNYVCSHRNLFKEMRKTPEGIDI
eukprot:406554-Ditylum_brightwellii.AAC.1